MEEKEEEEVEEKGCEKLQQWLSYPEAELVLMGMCQGVRLWEGGMVRVVSLRVVLS